MNGLNEQFRCNSRRKSVPVMDLVRAHRPADPEALRKLIEAHHRRPCTLCKCRSMGTVEHFASNLYMAQFEHDALKLPRRFTWDECYRFQYTLFAVAPLRGRAMEMESMRLVREALGATTFRVREATRHEDFDCGVDFVVEDRKTGKPVLGVQTKPESFLFRRDLVEQNKAKQKNFPAAVVFHVYDRRGEFSPTADALLQELIDPSSSVSSVV